jgi:hypothetical protein
LPSNFAEYYPLSGTPAAGEEFELCVIDYDEIVVPLPHPCHRSGMVLLMLQAGRRIDIEPTHWRKWNERSAKHESDFR